MKPTIVARQWQDKFIYRSNILWKCRSDYFVTLTFILNKRRFWDILYIIILFFGRNIMKPTIVARQWQDKFIYRSNILWKCRSDYFVTLTFILNKRRFWDILYIIYYNSSKNCSISKKTFKLT